MGGGEVAAFFSSPAKRSDAGEVARRAEHDVTEGAQGRRADLLQTGAKVNTGGPPSVGVHLTLTLWPIFSVPAS